MRADARLVQRVAEIHTFAAMISVPGVRHGDRGRSRPLASRLPGRLGECDAAAGARLRTAVLDVLAGTLASRLGRANDLPDESHRRAALLNAA